MAVTSISKVFEVLGQIRATTKRKAKTDYLESLKKNPIAHEFFMLACDKSINLWVTAPDVDNIFFSGKRLPGDMDKRRDIFKKLFIALHERKITGAKAIEAVRKFISSCNNEAPFYEATCYAGAINRHLNIGVADSAISKVWPDLVSDFAVQLAESLYNQTSGQIVASVRDHILGHYPITSEPKLDGLNATVIVEVGADRSVMSRSNNAFGALDPWAEALQAALTAATKKGFKYKHFCFNGEFKADRHVSDPKNWKSSWGKTNALCHAGINADGYDPANIDKYSRECLNRDMVYTIYNCYPFETYLTGKWDTPYGHHTMAGTRSALIKAFVSYVNKHFPGVRIEMIEQRLCHNMQDLKAANVYWTRQLKAEGSMLKRTDAGVTLDRTADFAKWKQYRTRDAIILGVLPGTNKYKGTAGSFICYLPDIDDTAKVTCRTEAVRDFAWKSKDIIAGYKIETRDDAGDTEVAKSRNPTLLRFRNDVAPVSEREVNALCHRFNIPKPKAQLDPKRFLKITSSIKL
jgi:hypothetical protein